MFVDAGEQSCRRFIEFSTANIRNCNTREVYARAAPHVVTLAHDSLPLALAAAGGEPPASHYLLGGVTLERPPQIAAHSRDKSTKLYERRNDKVTLDEIERIVM